MIGIISLILIGVGTIGLVIVSANTSNKSYRIMAEILACIGIFLLCAIIGCTAAISTENEKTQQEGNFEVSGASQETASPSLEEQLEMAEKKVKIAEKEAEANRIITESISPEILLKMLIEKWNGELPETVTVPVVYGEE